MICPICGHKKWLTSASSQIGLPLIPSHSHPIGRAALQVEMIFTCKRCGQDMSGQLAVDVVVPVSSVQQPYPAHLFHQIFRDYSTGWEARVKGRRLKREEQANLSIAQGWEDAQKHSEKNGGKPPPKGWGTVRAKKEYIRSEVAWQHLKLLWIRSQGGP